jgi:hypothetical protein
MAGVAVELDDEALRAPHRVDLEAGDVRVRFGKRQVRRLDEEQKPNLELTRAVVASSGR